ncbi:MAG: hypothetical protein IPN83_17755 [Holophagales bacterium]|jgi:hypothetical protein|nr:hypothetical protein [Holophagales bacterium]
MRRALLFAAALAFALAGPAGAQERPGPTTLPQGVAPGGLAARAGQMRLNRRVAGEMKHDAPPRPRAPVLKGGKMRNTAPTRPAPAPKRKPAPKRP